MKIVIDLPEETYNFIKENSSGTTTHEAIKNGTPLPKNKLSNSEWIGFLTEQFDISRTSAKEMLHVMMSVKREDNFKKQFSGREEADT